MTSGMCLANSTHRERKWFQCNDDVVTPIESLGPKKSSTTARANGDEDEDADFIRPPKQRKRIRVPDSDDDDSSDEDDEVMHLVNSSAEDGFKLNEKPKSPSGDKVHLIEVSCEEQDEEDIEHPTLTPDSNLEFYWNPVDSSRFQWNPVEFQWNSIIATIHPDFADMRFH